jgi:hypothetical protein
MDGRAEEVAAERRDAACRETDAHRRRHRVRAERVDEIERDRTRDVGMRRHEHHPVAEPLHDRGARRRDHVGRHRLERRDGAVEAGQVEALDERRRGVATVSAMFSPTAAARGPNTAGRSRRGARDEARRAS